MLQLSRYIVSSDSFVDSSTGFHARVVLSTRSLNAMVLSEHLWQRIIDGDIARIADSETRLLTDAEILVEEGIDELAEILLDNRAAIAESRMLYECIQPTAACQLGCDYCGQTHQSKVMTADTQDLVVARIKDRLRAGTYEHLRIGWFGAEPLLGIAAIRTLTPRLRNVADDAGCSFSAHMVTNGLALSEKLGAELSYHLGVDKFEITLDGPRQAHDARRYTKAGQPTFRRIFNNLVNLARSEKVSSKIVVRCNVDHRNAGFVPELIEELAKARLQDRIELYLAPIHDWGNGAGAMALPPEEYAQQEVDWLALMALRGFTPPLMPKRKPIVCMAVTPHSELIDPDGQIFNCSEAPLVKSYLEPNVFSLGSLTQSRPSRHAKKLSQFLEDVERGEFDCHTCPMLPVCGGACPKAWGEGKLPCPSAKWNMGERLLLAYALSRIERMPDDTC